MKLSDVMRKLAGKDEEEEEENNDPLDKLVGVANKLAEKLGPEDEELEHAKSMGSAFADAVTSEMNKQQALIQQQSFLDKMQTNRKLQQAGTATSQQKMLEQLMKGVATPPVPPEDDLFNKLSEYVNEKGGECSHEKLSNHGIKFYLFEVAEKMFREVIIPEIEAAAEEKGWIVQVDEGATVIREGWVKWSEVIIV
jgi:hypothetical protein